MGEGIRRAGVPRSDFFLTTKLWNDDIRARCGKDAFQESLDRLGVDYVDLYLIHWPADGWQQAWDDLQEIYASGRAKAIGVSNFAPDRLMDLALHAKVCPMVNQIEINPFCQQRDAFPVMKDLGVVPQAWAPLAEGRNGLFFNSTLRLIAQKHGASVAQVVLAYVSELGASVVSKSVSPARMKENLSAADLVLDDEDRKMIRALDRNESQFFSHRDPAIIRWFSERRIAH